jgi:maltooligosyltrehalose synthase
VLELPHELEGLAWRNVLTGETLPGAPRLRLGDLLACFPIALLAGERAP